MNNIKYIIENRLIELYYYEYKIRHQLYNNWMNDLKEVLIKQSELEYLKYLNKVNENEF